MFQFGFAFTIRSNTEAPGAALPPLVATLAADGISLQLVFPVPMFINSSSAGFSLRGQFPAQAGLEAVYDSGDATDTLEFILGGPFYATEALRLTFLQPGGGVGDGTDPMASFSNFTVINNSAIGTGILRDANGLPVPDANGRAIPITEP